MEIGFNDDVEYNGVTFHIQTEDHGVNDPRVSTQLFSAGRVLDNQVVNYGHLIEDLSEEEERKNKIRKVMVAAHRNVYKRLVSGEYDDAMGFTVDTGEEEEVDEEEEAIAEAVEAFVPSQSRVPEAAQIIEDAEGRVTFTFDHGEQMDLSMLRAQLNQVDVLPEDNGAVAFEDLTDEINADSMTEDVDFAPRRSTRPEARTLMIEPQNYMDAPRFKPTGKRAFQGLLEPPQSTDIIKLVLEHLAATSQA